MKATTALNKICSLKKKIRVIQGGAGAGKTYAILLVIIDFALKKAGAEIFIAGAELSKMKITVVKDFVKILRELKIFEKNDWKDNRRYEFKNGSFIYFLGLDKEDVGKGLRSDVLFLNEANKVKNFETYREMAHRAKNVFIDFNPNSEFWVHTEIINRSDCDFLILTFNDNEFLSSEEKHELFLYKEKGYNADGSIKNEYWANMWRVYGLGKTGRLLGAIYSHYVTGEFDKNLVSIYGLDFGVNDPDAMVEVAIDKKSNKIYVREVLYQNRQTTERMIDAVNTALNFDKNKMIIGDSAGAREIQDLKSNGFNIEPAKKLKVTENIHIFQQWQIVVSPDSKNLQRELDNYVWLNEQAGIPIDANNHLVDAMHYAGIRLMFAPKRSNMTLL